MKAPRLPLVGLLGVAMGFGLSRIGFSDYGEVHRMFTFQDFRLLFTFAGAVFVLMLGMPLLSRSRSPEARAPVHKGTVIGAVLFGAGWALTGACPSIALVQLGEGKLAALGTLAGILVGTAVYRPLHRRFFRWDSRSCDQ